MNGAFSATKQTFLRGTPSSPKSLMTFMNWSREIGPQPISLYLAFTPFSAFTTSPYDALVLLAVVAFAALLDFLDLLDLLAFALRLAIAESSSWDRVSRPSCTAFTGAVRVDGTLR